MEQDRVAQVVCVYGPVCAGKSAWAIDMYDTLSASLEVAVASLRDNKVSSRNGRSIPATYVSNTNQLRKMATSCDVLLVDEAQLSPYTLAPVAVALSKSGASSYWVGCDLTYQGQPFGHYHKLLELANRRVQLFAMCECGEKAPYSVKLDADGNTVTNGEAIDVDAEYQPACLDCFVQTTGLTPV